MRVLSWNIWGMPLRAPHIKKRFEKISSIINSKKDVDIVNFQEVFLYSSLRILKKGLSNFPYLIYQPFFYGPKGGLVVFSKKPLKKISFVPFPNRGTFKNHSLVDIFLFKGFLAYEISSNGWAINTHFPTNYNHCWLPDSIYGQHQQSAISSLIDFVRNQERKSCLYIAGDFNFPRHSKLYHDFINNLSLWDPHRETAKRRNLTIDFIFLPKESKGYITKTNYILTDKSFLFSDHQAISITINNSSAH